MMLDHDADQSAAAANAPCEPFGVYIHWPFCARICPYCDFNVYRDRGIDPDPWRAALIADLDHARALEGRGARAASLYFGGGTPSLAPPDLIAAVIDHVDRLWGLEQDAEITLEANPTSAEADRFRAYVQAGVNRLSLGVQSFDDDQLRFLGRDHTAQEARAALEAAREIFPRFTFDLIYGLPGQTVSAWRRALEDALALVGDHLSLYQLTIEPGTAFDLQTRKNRWAPPDDDVLAALYDAAQEICERAGLPAYEISNHARNGAEARHNLIYWRGGDYVGVGPGAHGRLTVDGARSATMTIKQPTEYLRAVEDHGYGLAEITRLSHEEQASELMLSGLRLAEGVECARFEALRGAALVAKALDPLVEGGLVALDGGRLRATAAGRRVLDRVIAQLLL